MQFHSSFSVRGLVLATVLAFGLAAPASAGMITLFADINGGQEVPPVSVMGVGSAGLIFDDTTNVLTWAILYSGLTGDLQAAHFHDGLAGANGNVVLDIGAISGLPSGTSGLLSGSATVDASQVANLLNEGWYINLHTVANPSGEIRGQVQNSTTQIPVPEPAAAALLGVSLVAAATHRRRRMR